MESRTEQSWLLRAREARRRLTAAKMGEKEKILYELAGGREVSSVRRLLRALSLHDRWIEQGRVVSPRLLAAPQTIIEALSRWAEFDEDAAWLAFLDWERNHTSVQVLNTRVTEKRRVAGLDVGKGLETEFRESIRDRILEIIKKEFGPDAYISLEKADRRTFGSPTVDFECIAYREPAAPGEHIAVVIVGPYRGAGLYGRKLTDWMQKALSLAWIYHTVILVVPENRYVADYYRWLETFATTDRPGRDQHPDVRILAIS